MYLQQHGPASPLRNRQIHVQQPPLTRGRVRHVAHIAHTGAPEAKRPQPFATMNLLLESYTPRGRELCHEICAEGRGQGAAKRCARVKSIA